MITLKQVSLAISNILNNVLPNIEIQSNNIEEGFKRPSLFFEFSNVTTASYISNKRERVIDIIIYYFPYDQYDNEIELYETQDILEEAFRQPFEVVDGFFVFPLEVGSIVTDGVLQTSFSITLLESANEEAGSDIELINEVQINITKGD